MNLRRALPALLLLGCRAAASGGDDLGDAPVAVDLRPVRNRDAACASARAEARLVKRPVDVIFVIDNSGSMTDEIQAVERNINGNFAAIIDGSGADYRVIMLSRHGNAAKDVGICVSAPLSGVVSCSPPPARPVNGPRFFHYSADIQSTDSLDRILRTYNLPDPEGQSPGGWSRWLRAGSVKVFIEITDDNSALSAELFDARLRKLEPAHFGVPGEPQYVFHSIVGLKQSNPATRAWQPGEALQTSTCGSGAVNTGSVYQQLSRLSGGLRFPICEYQSFDAVFKAVATGVVEGVSCTVPIPAAPAGQRVDPSSLAVTFTPGSGAPRELGRAEEPAACGSDGFYVQGDRILLCPATCQAAQKDAQAKLEVTFDCVVEIG